MKDEIICDIRSISKLENEAYCKPIKLRYIRNIL